MFDLIVSSLRILMVPDSMQFGWILQLEARIWANVRLVAYEQIFGPRWLRDHCQKSTAWEHCSINKTAVFEHPQPTTQSADSVKVLESRESGVRRVAGSDLSNDCELRNTAIKGNRWQQTRRSDRPAA
ncbi:hypothetical protein V2G26_012142 [Clonostachys chloroleuca]